MSIPTNQLTAGWMVWIYSPIVGISAIEVYYGGVGGSIFVGTSCSYHVD